jgi:uncharacterized protein YkwD
MSKGLFWALFLFVCATSALGKKPMVAVPVPDEEQQIDQMFDSTNRLRAERRIPILGLDARLCHAATVHAEEMARYNYTSVIEVTEFFPFDRTQGPELWPAAMPGRVSQRRFAADLRMLAPF